MVGTIIWAISIMVFASYPFLTFSARRIRLILYVHLCFPATVLLWVLGGQGLFGALFANLILAYSLMVYHSKKAIGIPSRHLIMIFLSTLFALVIMIETFAMIAIAVNPVHVLSLFSSQNVGILAVARFSLNLFGLFDSATLILFLLLIMCGFIFCFFRYDQESIDDNERRMRLGWVADVVGIGILSAVPALLPYFYVKPPVGIDAAWYVHAVDTLTSERNLASLFISEPRAVYVVILYAIKLAVGETAYALVVGVAILSGLAALANYSLAWKLFYRRDVALLAAAMSSLAPQILVVSFAAIFDSWLALVEMLFLFRFLRGMVERQSVSRLVLSLCMSILLMITHLWSWVMAMLIIVTLGLLGVNDRPTLKTCFFVVGGSVIFLTLFGLIPAYVMPRNAIAFGIWILVSNLQFPSSFVLNLSNVLKNYVGGMYSNWIMMALANMGILSLVNGKFNKRLFQAWIITPSVFMFFSGSDLQWRLLFLLPTSLLSAIGLKSTVNFLHSRFHLKKATMLDLSLLSFLEIAFVVAVILLLWNNVLRSMIFIAAST